MLDDDFVFTVDATPLNIEEIWPEMPSLDDDDGYFPGGVATNHGDGLFEFSLLATTWGYDVFGEGITVEGGTQLEDGSWRVPGGVGATTWGADADLNGIPDGVTFVPYGGV